MISVIIPYDKDRGFLDQCVKSIESQTYQDFEIIHAKSNCSVAVNFNFGLKMAKGEFCKFVTEDDWLPENSLQDLVDGIGDAPWAYANAIQYEHPAKTTWIYKPNTHDLKSNIRQNQIHGGTTIYRTKVLLSIGGMDESLWTGEEYEMHLRLWSKGINPRYIDKEVYIHRLWNGQKSKKLRRINRDKRDGEIKRIQSLYKT
jgi:glycosyltransferase involved in cell wall biosynthesis